MRKYYPVKIVNGYSYGKYVHAIHEVDGRWVCVCNEQARTWSYHESKPITCPTCRAIMARKAA